MEKAKKQEEVIVIEKVFDFITHTFPKDLKKAAKEFKKSVEAQAANDERDYTRGLMSYFLLERKINLGLTPMELAQSFPLDFFTKQDRKIINNFVDHTTSIFDVKRKNGKEILLEDAVSGRRYLVKTIDFPDVLENGEFVKAILVKKLEGDYFFYGNVLTYARAEGLKMKEYLLKNIGKIKKRQKPEIEWKIEYKK
ncbi:hypothetical protein J4448_03305 [Candidatus Woesearchaeota archaeon]|nr:hypothetical protein [Candidatus Woesearchaeota archaeon]